MLRVVRRQRITIVYEHAPPMETINEELQFFGSSLGLFNLRDKDRSAFRIFIELLKAAKTRRPLSSDELAYLLHLTRATVVHHLHHMMESGLVVSIENRYILRAPTLIGLIDELQKDFKKASDELRKVAQVIDDDLGDLRKSTQPTDR